MAELFADREPRFVVGLALRGREVSRSWSAGRRRRPSGPPGLSPASFTHVGDKVTFEVVAESFGLLEDAALGRFARLVHCIDVGGIPVDEAPGFEMLVRGLQARHANDDRLLAAALPVFDAYYAALQAANDE